MAGSEYPDVGQRAPDFCLKDQDDREACLEAYRGKWVVLYFYPRDNTSGCTTEAIDFSSVMDRFRALNATVLGVSPDSVNSHRRFAAKHQLRVRLLSDPEHSVIERYGVWQLKRMYGKESYGVVRSTFLIDPEGTVRRAWPKVQAAGHADEVRQVLVEVQQQDAEREAARAQEPAAEQVEPAPEQEQAQTRMQVQVHELVPTTQQEEAEKQAQPPDDEEED